MSVIDVISPDGCAIWPVDTSLCDDFSSFSPEVEAVALAVAVSNLYYLTGARFGACDVTYRPCIQRDIDRLSTWDIATGMLSRPHLAGRQSTLSLDFLTSGTLTGTACSDCVDPGLAQLHLPTHPINHVVSMIEDGSTVPVTGTGTSFAIIDRRTVIRQDGNTFPVTQDITKPITDPGTWAITVNVGQPVPSETSLIAGFYACELAKSLSDLDCVLPDTVVSAQRQGINYQFATPEFLERGLVGHRLIDTFILTHNPNRLVSKPTVASPDTLARKAVRETWSGSSP